MAGDGAQPVGIAAEAGQAVVVEEIDGSVDDRLLAVVLLDDLQEGAHLAAHGGRIRPQLAGRRLRVPLHVEDRRQGALFLRHIVDEPARLLGGRTAEIIEVIGGARHAGCLRLAPVLGEEVIDAIAALGGLDEGEGDAAGPGLVPVDGALVFRHVGAVDGVVPRRTALPLVRVAVGKARMGGGDPGRTGGGGKVGRQRIDGGAGRQHGKKGPPSQVKRHAHFGSASVPKTPDAARLPLKPPRMIAEPASFITHHG